MLRNKTFAPGFCSLISNWFDMREQAAGANLLHESVSGASSLVCTEICLPWNNVSPVGQQIGLIFHPTSSHAPIGLFHQSAPARRVLRVYWLGYLPWSVFRGRVSGASSLVCTGLRSFQESFVKSTKWLAVVHDHSFPATSGPPFFLLLRSADLLNAGIIRILCHACDPQSFVI